MFSLYLFLAFTGVVSASYNSSTFLVTTTTTEGCACQELSTAHPEFLYYPNSTAYTTVNLEAWDTRSNLEPSCIFNPVTADQVADGMSIISKCNAQFAIRGGGHMNVSCRLCMRLVIILTVFSILERTISMGE
jgi:hypothetical protein